MKLIDWSSQLAQKWKDDVISLNTTGQAVVDVTGWLSRTTLDIIAESKCSTAVIAVSHHDCLLRSWV